MADINICLVDEPFATITANTCAVHDSGEEFHYDNAQELIMQALFYFTPMFNFLCLVLLTAPKVFLSVTHPILAFLTSCFGVAMPIISSLSAWTVYMAGRAWMYFPNDLKQLSHPILATVTSWFGIAMPIISSLRAWIYTPKDLTQLSHPILATATSWFGMAMPIISSLCAWIYIPKDLTQLSHHLFFFVGPVVACLLACFFTLPFVIRFIKYILVLLFLIICLIINSIWNLFFLPMKFIWNVTIKPIIKPIGNLFFLTIKSIQNQLSPTEPVELGEILSIVHPSDTPSPQRGCFSNWVTIDDKAGFTLTARNTNQGLIHRIDYTGNQRGQTIIRYIPPSDNDPVPAPSLRPCWALPLPFGDSSVFGGETIVQAAMKATSKKRVQAEDGRDGNNKKAKVASPTGNQFTIEWMNLINTNRNDVELDRLQNAPDDGYLDKIAQTLFQHKDKTTNKKRIYNHSAGTTTHAVRIFLQAQITPSDGHHYMLLEKGFAYGPFVFSKNVVDVCIRVKKYNHKFTIVIVFKVEDVPEQSMLLDEKLRLSVRVSSLTRFQTMAHFTEIGAFTGDELIQKYSITDSGQRWVEAYFYKKGDNRDDKKAMIRLLKPLLHPDMLPFVIMHYQEKFDNCIDQLEKTKQAIAEDFACPHYEVLFDEVYNKENVKHFRGL